MNISLPDALRERMQPFDDQVSWSGIAAAAFQREVDRRAELASIDDEVKRRLRQTEMEDDDNAYEAGVRAGQEWAKHRARMVHLKRLHAAEEALERMPEVTPDTVARVALKDTSARWHDLNEWHVENHEIEAGWALGFVKGALEVYGAL